MSKKIINIYKFKSETGIDSYIYSTRKTTDNLGYNYYLLTRDENNIPTIYETVNTIKLLHSNELNLKPIDEKNSEEYKKFLSEFLVAINTPKEKEEVLSRK